MASRTCIKKESLKNLGYKDLENWLENENNIYIGRRMSHRVPGAEKSKWCNPYTIKKYGTNTLILFAKHIKKSIKNSDLDITVLEGKNLGCFCNKSVDCHGDVLIKMLKENEVEKQEEDEKEIKEEINTEIEQNENVLKNLDIKEKESQEAEISDDVKKPRKKRKPKKEYTPKMKKILHKCQQHLRYNEENQVKFVWN